jgi:hypothetical protein
MLMIEGAGLDYWGVLASIAKGGNPTNFLSSKYAHYITNETITYVGEIHSHPCSPGAIRQLYIAAAVLVVAYDFGSIFNQGMKDPHKFFQTLTDYDPGADNNIEMLYRLMRDDVLKSKSCFRYFRTLAETPNELNLLSLNLFLTQLQDAQLGTPDHVISLVDGLKRRIQTKKDQVKAAATAQQAQPKGNKQGSIKSAFDPHSQPVPPGQVAPDVPFPNLVPPSSKRCTHLLGKYRKTPTNSNDPSAGYV